MSMGQTQQTSFHCTRRPNRRTIAARIVPLAIAALLLAAPLAGRMAQAQTADYDGSSGSGSAGELGQPMSKGPAVDVAVVNASLLSVVQAIELQSKAQIVVVNSKRYQPVTVSMEQPLADVLQYIAQSAGAIVTRDANGVYTFRPATDQFGMPTVVPATYSPQSAAAALQEAKHTEMIQLRYVDPNYILLMINDPSGVRQFNPTGNPLSDPYVANGPTGQHQVVTMPSLYEASPYDGSRVSPQQQGVPLQGGYSNPANQANDRAAQPGSEANQYIPGGGGGFGGPFSPNQIINPGGASVNPFPGGNANTPGAGNFGNVPGQQNVPGQGQAGNLRPQGIDSIIANEENNALIVRGTPEGIAELKQIIGFLDRAPRQVQIKVEFITTDVANVDAFGINWEFVPFSNLAAAFNGGGAASGTVGTSYLTFAQGNIATQLLSTLTSTNSKVVAAPIVTTTNNVQGEIDFSSEIPYTTTTTVAQGSGNAISNSTVNFLQLTNQLLLTPRINGDDSISLSLRPTLTAVTGAAVSGPPPTSQQAVQTYRTVANGETMVIGGLVQKNITNAHNYIPFLSQLPIIGSLFRTRNLSVSDSELLIFVTPTILPPIGSGVAQTPTEGGGVPTSGDSSAGVGVSP